MLHQFPQEIGLLVLGELNFHDVGRVMQCSKTLRDLCLHGSLWRNFQIKLWGKQYNDENYRIYFVKKYIAQLNWSIGEYTIRKIHTGQWGLSEGQLYKNWIAVAFHSGFFVLYNSVTGLQISSVDVLESILCMQIDDEKAVIGTSSGTIFIISIPKMEIKKKWQAHLLSIASLQFSSEYIITCVSGQQEEIKVWNFEGKEIVISQQDKKSVDSLIESKKNEINKPQNSNTVWKDVAKLIFEMLDTETTIVQNYIDKIAIGRRNGKIVLLDSKGKKMYDVHELLGAVTALQFDENRLFCGDSYGTLMILDFSSKFEPTLPST